MRNVSVLLIDPTHSASWEWVLKEASIVDWGRPKYHPDDDRN